ncbi:PEX11-domain-containing protein [Fomitiporia mediterranea MF3/22]|uniref:PEX11-domain-containing protein n=1 Tax=Fomitiporia mediterranea (strain MF3/22) TaxID=694068 RepID=UPI00044099D0|nr:PEX11-domain-containing protein [Fomitiporia mediterranea MF3/22]EJD03852.1 PEX11-domain-containing protein [Fomitiporia mediterranea MF3/22]
MSTEESRWSFHAYGRTSARELYLVMHLPGRVSFPSYLILFLSATVMTTIASQVILHPTASQSLNLLATTIGRDKLYRALQYFARFWAWALIAKGYNSEAERWNALKSHLATGRKLLRLGKPLEHLQAALRAASSFTRPGEQITTILRQLCYAGYLIYDAAVWANAAKFVTLSKEANQKAVRRSNRLWFFGIVFSICHGLLKAGRLANEAKGLRGYTWGDKSVSTEAERAVKYTAVEKERKVMRSQFVIDLLDVWIPATNLGYVNLNDGVLGLFGFITSVMALRTQWAAAANKVKA